MDTITAISERRSIRKYESTPILKDNIYKIIHAGTQAPSPKNRQPWRFVVVEGDAKAGMISAMSNGLEQEIANPKLPVSSKYIPFAKNTIAIMQQAPVTIFILNPLNSMYDFPAAWEERFYDAANVQSVGACIQNMILAAVNLGYGSLWNCDIYFAYDEISKWLDTREQIVAAVSFGVPAEKPHERPRNNLTDLIKWK